MDYVFYPICYWIILYFWMVNANAFLMRVRIRYHPPFYLPLWKLFFPHADFESIVFVWGNNIYTKYKLDQALFVHEYTHCEQQRLSKFWGTIWLIRYVLSSEFRFTQEIEAYQNQYAYYCARDKDRNYQAKFLHTLASDLSSPLYGFLIPYEKARNRIAKMI